MTLIDEAIVLVTPRSFGTHDPVLRHDLESAVGEVRYNSLGRPFSAAELCDLVGDVDGIIAGLDPFDASVLAAAARLRVVARYGVGTSNVDLDAAARLRITVTNTPGANTESVAELAIGLLFALARRIPRLDREVRTGGWPTLRGVEIHGKTLGIVGLGQIGRAVARRAAALGCRVLAYDPDPRAAAAAPDGVHMAALERLLPESDFVSLHLPLLPETRGMLNRDWLSQMREGAYLINTARGELVDEDALLWALAAGWLAGAALDTLCAEPPPGNHPLLMRDDVIVTPHCGSHTRDAALAMGRTALNDLLAVLSGKAPRHVVPVSAQG